MLAKIRLSFLAVLAVAFLMSCSNGGDDNVRAEARNAVQENPSAVTPSTTPTPPTAPQAPTGPTTTVQFEETEFDFGKVKAGEKVRHTYKFKNTGSEPLIISNAKGSCGCTVPSWPREPIPPGGTGEVTVEFNSKNKKGPRNQKVTITANTDPPQIFLYLKGEVEPADGGTTTNVQVQ